MDYAIDVLAHRRVPAGHGSHHRIYICAACRAAVHFRSGSKRSSHFAHNPGVGDPSCELFASADGIARGPQPASSGLIAPLQLCIDEDGMWQLYVEFAPVDLDEWDNADRTRYAGSTVRFEDDNARRLHTRGVLDLWPGTGRNAVPLEPATTRTKFAASGRWPNRVERRRWNRTVPPVVTSGTLFARHLGGGFRRYDPQTTPLQWGDAIILVRTTANPPHQSLHARRLETRQSRAGTWHAWEITLPRIRNSTIEHWLSTLGASIEPAGQRPLLLTVPTSYGPDSVPRYSVGTPVALQPGAGWADIYLHSNGRGERVAEIPGGAPISATADAAAESVIVAAAGGMPWAEFQVMEAHGPEMLDSPQRWQVACGGQRFGPHGNIALDYVPQTLEVHAGDCPAYFDVHVQLRDARPASLIAADSTEATRWLADHLANATAVRIDAGNLGIVEITIDASRAAVSDAPVTRPAIVPDSQRWPRWAKAFARATDDAFIPHWRYSARRTASHHFVNPAQGVHR